MCASCESPLRVVPPASSGSTLYCPSDWVMMASIRSADSAISDISSDSVACGTERTSDEVSDCVASERRDQDDVRGGRESYSLTLKHHIETRLKIKKTKMMNLLIQ